MKTSVLILLYLLFFSFQGFGQCVNSVLFNELNRSAHLPQTNAYYSGANGGFTWECWFRLVQPLGSSQVRPLIVATDSVVFEDIWLGFGWNGGYFNQPTSKLVFLVYGPNGMAPTDPNCSYEPAGGFQVGVWYHVAATMNYTTHMSSLFVDGVQVDSQPTSVPPNTRVIPTSLSCPLVANNQFTLNGNMDEVRMWNRPLTTQEIYDKYKHCAFWTEPELELYYHCNDGGQNLFDASMYQHHAALPAMGGLWSNDAAPLADQSCMATCATCPLLDAGADVVTCGGSVQLSATPGWSNYAWSPSAGMSDPGAADQTVSPSVTTTYTVQSTGLGNNLVINGDLSQGNVGFTNGYINSLVYSPCNYHVGPQFFSLNDPTLVDHTPTNDNMMLAIDGCWGNEILWEQTFVVQPYTNYLFGFWATRAAQIQPIFQTILTGDVTGPQVLLTQNGLPTTGAWIWDQYGNNFWNSANNNTITITVTNMEVNGFGNDFAMDDFTLQQQCDVSSQVTVYIGGMPVDLGPDLEVCANASHVLNAGNGYQSYLWSDGSTASTLTVNASGSYWVVANDSCGGTHSDTINVAVLPAPSLDLGSDIHICAGDTTSLSASSSTVFSSYQWAPGTGLSCSTCQAPSAFPAGSTLYILTATTAQGCSTTDSVQVLVAPLPDLDLGNDLSICAGDSVQLVAASSVAIGTYQWFPAAGSSQGMTVSPNLTTTYIVMGTTAQGCTSSDSIRVAVLTVPPLELGNDLGFCVGGHEQFVGAFSNAFVGYQWTPATGLSCDDCSHPDISPEVTTTYILTAVTADGCTASDTLAVVVKDDAPTDVLVTVTDVTCQQAGTVVIEAVGNGVDALQYNFDQQGFTPVDLHEGLGIGNYLLSVRNGDNGCPFITVVEVGGAFGSVYIPNAFTPDGNEHNNTWRIQGECISEIYCRIFNQWGEEIAAFADLSAEWDGTFNGAIVQDGIYTYSVEVTYSSYQKELLTGFIAVLR